MNNNDDSLLWQVRAFVYRHFGLTGRPPSVAETSDQFSLGSAEIEDLYRRLHQAHAFFLEPDSSDIRMANPFSAVPTGFRVQVDGRGYWANCAWDALGIPAALHADATISATCSDSDEMAALKVIEGQVLGHGQLVHFPLPFRHWYDDLVFT